MKSVQCAHNGKTVYNTLSMLAFIAIIILSDNNADIELEIYTAIIYSFFVQLVCCATASLRFSFAFGEGSGGGVPSRLKALIVFSEMAEQWGNSKDYGAFARTLYT